MKRYRLLVAAMLAGTSIAVSAHAQQYSVVNDPSGSVRIYSDWPALESCIRTTQSTGSISSDACKKAYDTSFVVPNGTIVTVLISVPDNPLTFVRVNLGPHAKKEGTVLSTSLSR